MNQAEQNDEIIRDLFDKSDDLRLSKDVVFVVGPPNEVERFSGADLIELIRSNDFVRIFSESDDESDETVKDIDEIFLTDLVWTVFLNLLRYVYKKEMITDLNEVHSTYAAADRYSLTGLTEDLLKFCEHNLTIDNSTIIYDQYLQIGDISDDDLERVLDVIQPHAFLAFQSIQFLHIRQETLIDLLDSDKLFIKEKELYLRCLCWMDAELARQSLEPTKKNKSKLFNQLKHLIRFPVMSKQQFFDKKSIVSPSKCGLFTAVELKEFEKYYKSGSEKALSVNYKTEPRAGLQIGKLTFNREKKLFEMDVDNVFDDSDEEECSLINFVDAGGDFPGLDEMDNQTRRTSQVPAKSSGTRKSKSRASLTNNNIESISLFRIKSNCSDEHFERGYHPSILEDGESMNIKFRRYLLDDSDCYFDIHPRIDLKKDHKYCFEFFTHDNHYARTTFKLANVYTVKKNAAQINVKLKLIGEVAWAVPETIYFLYQ